MVLNMVDIISKKREGLELTTEEIRLFIQAVVNKTVSDAAVGAMLMALFIKDMNLRETIDFTKFMVNSGTSLAFKNFAKDTLVDKHSTGGIGDKVSIILVPIMAACGLKIPMISGWGLHFTGGTLDKLQSIPGFRTALDLEEMEQCLIKAGCFICCSSDKLCPADSLLYKIRDITATVENKSLIASSIVSKKVVERVGNVVFDVKFGKGAFMKTEKDAHKLADLMVKVAKKLDLKAQAVLSEMNSPLGEYVGAALEIIESVQCLRNEKNNNTLELVKVLGARLLISKDVVKTIEEGKAMIDKTLENKSALKHFKMLLISQGVSENNAAELCEGNFNKVLPQSSHKTILLSPAKGVIKEIDALKIGKACWYLGGGRKKLGDDIDYSVGIVLLKQVGDEINKDEPWIIVHHNNNNGSLSSGIEEILQKSLKIHSDSKNINKDIKIVLLK